jgi:MFS family permease
VLPRTGRRRQVRIYWLSTALLASAITCLVLLTTWGGTEYAWGSPVIAGLGVATVVLGGLFVLVEHRAPEPAIPLRLFRTRTFNVAIGVSFVVGMALFGAITYLPTFLQVANGASASNSGLLLVPMMVGLLITSIIVGQIITRTGRYRRFPIAGMAVSSVAMYLLSTLDTGSSRWESGLYMALLGAGIGMVMQILILATQNEAPVEDLGVATSTVTFFRAVGGSVGVALFGALFTHRLTDLLGVSVPAGITPGQIAQLPADQRALLAGAFSDAITAVFLYAVPLLVLGFVVTWWLREKPLRTASAEAQRSRAAAPLEAEVPEVTMVATGDRTLVVDWSDPGAPGPDGVRRGEPVGVGRT